MAIPVNFDGVDAWQGGGMLPEGMHTCRIKSAEEGRSSNGHPQVELEFEAVEGEYVGATIRDWLVVVPQTFGKVKQLVEAAKLDYPAGEFALEARDLVGRRVAILVREEPDHKGESRRRVKSYDPADGSDLPADTSGLPPVGGTASKRDEDIPF
jgi:hypothetical protein